MSRASRVELIRQLEALRGRRTLAIVLGDRQNLNTQIASDSLSIASTLLEEIGHVDALDLYLYSTGGITMSAYALVNLIREHAARFYAVVPYKALSAATLICLGADEIVMMPLASLSPVDPSVNGPANPLVPNLPAGMFPPQTIPVSVEDVASYLRLAREEAGLSREDDLREVFLQLSRDVRPLALGSVQRAREQIRMLSAKLLEQHAPQERWHRRKWRKYKNGKIVETLTAKLFSHDYPIGRREAREIGLNVAEPGGQEAEAIQRLYREYEQDLRLLVPYTPELELGQAQRTTVNLERAYIETTADGWGFTSQHELTRAAAPAPMGGGIMIPTVAVRAVSEEWRKL